MDSQGIGIEHENDKVLGEQRELAMKVRCSFDKLVNVDELKLHPKNRNTHPDEQIARLAQVLDYQGWRSPIKVSQLSGFVTAGHGRLLAAKRNGWLEVPVNFQEYESEEQEYADVQSDNAIATWAVLDLEAVEFDTTELGVDFDLALLGLQKGLELPSESVTGKTSTSTEKELTEQKTEHTCPECGHEY